MSQRVAYRSMDLRNAAQGVGVSAPAFAMRFANLASFQHATQVSRALYLTAVGTDFMDAFIECGIRAFQCIAG